MEPAFTVVICTWKRIESFPWQIANLLSQTRRDFRVFVWNNNGPEAGRLEKLVAAANRDIYSPDGRPLNIKIHHSPQNVAGWGRFYAVRDEMVTGPVVFLDDDLLLAPDGLDTLMKFYKERVLAGRWAWNLNHPRAFFPRRTRCKPGQTADFIGTGGMVMDPELLQQDWFYDKRPVEIGRQIDKFLVPGPVDRLAEDLWVSVMARDAGYTLIATPEVCVTVIDGHNQSDTTGAMPGKQRLYEWIQDRKQAKAG